MHMPRTIQEIAQEIRFLYGVVPSEQFDPETAVNTRVAYLKTFLRNTGRKAYVLGISGGVDSSVTGKLCQMAVEQLRAENYDATFVAMRLPADIQRDEQDAQKALAFINPDVTLIVNVGPASTLMHIQAVQEFERIGRKQTAAQQDFNKGNMKARLRMCAQYEQAAQFEGLVIGTDHNAEAVMGFFTLFGDGACDLTVLNGLNKRQIRRIAQYLQAPESVWAKPPTSDLEELSPGKLDDEGFGFSYEYLDDFLEGKSIPDEVLVKLTAQYERTMFKRNPIPGFRA
jgi:NAD+ synthase